MSQQYSAEKLRKMSIFKLLWAMYNELMDDRSDFSSGRDNSGMIIGRYALIIENKISTAAITSGNPPREQQE